tara:strand:- start:13711 stop:14022 length:312 start_codon:yes stop_codon:yes gene_type:complete
MSSPADNAVELGESFRQSKREMWVILGAWVFFLLWTGISCAVLTPNEVSEANPMPTVLGIPRWAAFGIVLPWFGALAFIFWFASRFMKDTNLGPGDGEEGTDS